MEYTLNVSVVIVGIVLLGGMAEGDIMGSKRIFGVSFGDLPVYLFPLEIS
jgi:hypothetical protein